MFGDTLTLRGNTYTKINQDQYGAVYRFANTTDEARITVRHSSRIDKTRNNMRIDRHNIELAGRHFGTGGDPDSLQKIYLVIENDVNANSANVVLDADGLMAMLQASTKALLTKLANWES